MSIIRCGLCEKPVDYEKEMMETRGGLELCESCTYEYDARQNALSEDPAYDKWIIERNKEDMEYRREQSCR